MVQLVPEPLPALSTSSQDQELDVTVDEMDTPETEDMQRHTEQEAGSTEQETSAEGEETFVLLVIYLELLQLFDQ